MLSWNFLLGNRDVKSREEYEQHGDTMPCDYSGLNSFCEALKPKSIKQLDLSECRLDASATSTLKNIVKFSNSSTDLNALKTGTSAASCPSA